MQWKIPVVLIGVTVLVRLVLAPFWLYQETEREKLRLEKAADEHNDRRSKSTALAGLHRRGLELKAEILDAPLVKGKYGLGDEIPEPIQRAVGKWRSDVLGVVAECISPSKAQWVDAAQVSGSVFDQHNMMPTDRFHLERFVAVRLERLEEILEKS